MRRLHAVARHEGFVASGRYIEYIDEEPSGLVERWSIHEVGGAEFIRVDHDSREVDGRSVLIEALRRPNGQFDRVDMHSYEPAQSQALRVTADFYQSYIEMIRAGGSIQRFALPERAGVWLGGWILLGLSLTPDVERLLQWTGESFTEFAVMDLGQGVQSVAGRDYQTRRQRIGELVTVALDEAQVALGVETESTEAILREYARRA